MKPNWREHICTQLAYRGEGFEDALERVFDRHVDELGRVTYEPRENIPKPPTPVWINQCFRQVDMGSSGLLRALSVLRWLLRSIPWREVLIVLILALLEFLRR